jgi:hypothetical protein
MKANKEPIFALQILSVKDFKLHFSYIGNAMFISTYVQLNNILVLSRRPNRADVYRTTLREARAL